MNSQTVTPIMFVRNTNDTDSHIATGWTDQAFCGANPLARTLGWTLGAQSAFLSSLTVCEDCKQAYGSLMTSLAAKGA